MFFLSLSRHCLHLWKSLTELFASVGLFVRALEPLLLSLAAPSLTDLVSKIKTKEDDKEITKFEKSFQSPGIKKVPSTPHANPDKTKTVSWNFGSKEAASMNFISAQLETSPVGIIIDVDDEFRALKNGLYRIRNVVGSENRHALIVMARGRTEDGQDFLIVQNSWKKSWGVDGYGRLILADDMRCLAFYPLM
ncbi:hypothetical protein YC2023_063125 [Brassica napus]